MCFDKRLYPSPKGIIVHIIICRNSLKNTNFFAENLCRKANFGRGIRGEEVPAGIENEIYWQHGE